MAICINLKSCYGVLRPIMDVVLNVAEVYTQVRDRVAVKPKVIVPP